MKQKNLYVLPFRESYKLSFLIYMILNFTLSAQQYSKKQIDQWIEESYELSDDFRFIESIALSKKTAEASDKINYTRGIIDSWFNLAYDNCNLGDYKESNKYISKLEYKFPEQIANDIDLRANILDVKGRNHIALGFYRQAVREFKKELTVINAIQDPVERKLNQSTVYTSLAAAYSYYDMDSSDYYFFKSYSIIKNINHEKAELALKFMYIDLSDYYLESFQDIDSAEYFIDESLRLSKKYEDKYIYMGLQAKAKILYKRHKFKESLTYCFQALPITKKYLRTENEIELYKIISDNYAALKQHDKQILYLKKYISTKDSMESVRKSGVEPATQILLAQKDKSYKLSFQNMYLTIIIIIIILLAVISIWVRGLKRKRNIIIEQKNKLEIQTQDLQLKLNKTWDEITGLARTNDPVFLPRFKEIYPEFFDKFIRIYPEITSDQLKFCALVKLHFSTKEIAEITFITIRSVETKRMRLRKKLKISPEEDFYLWIGKL